MTTSTNEGGANDVLVLNLLNRNESRFYYGSFNYEEENPVKPDNNDHSSLETTNTKPLQRCKMLIAFTLTLVVLGCLLYISLFNMIVMMTTDGVEDISYLTMGFTRIEHPKLYYFDSLKNQNSEKKEKVFHKSKSTSKSKSSKRNKRQSKKSNSKSRSKKSSSSLSSSTDRSKHPKADKQKFSKSKSPKKTKTNTKSKESKHKITFKITLSSSSFIQDKPSKSESNCSSIISASCSLDVFDSLNHSECHEDKSVATIFTPTTTNQSNVNIPSISPFHFQSSNSTTNVISSTISFSTNLFALKDSISTSKSSTNTLQISPYTSFPLPNNTNINIHTIPTPIARVQLFFLIFASLFAYWL